VEESAFQPEHFQREDEGPDAAFYAAPRLVVHIDEGAITAAGRLYGELLPPGADLLDLMSSFRSHLPPELNWARLVGLGMNDVELRENPQLTAWVVHDLNDRPGLPFEEASFDGAVMTVSVQYLTRPVEVFRDLARVLRPGAPFVVTYSNRMFPTKAVRAWRLLDDRERANLVGAYFRESGEFTQAQARVCASGADGDPLYGVWAYRTGGVEDNVASRRTTRTETA